MEKRTNLTARETATKMMRKRARLCRWQKRKVRSQAEADQKDGALMAKGLPEPPLSGERIYFLCNS